MFIKLNAFCQSTSFVTLCLVFYAENAYAYIDPSTIGILLQAIVGGIAFAIGAIAMFWDTLKEKIKKIFSKS
jgi:uncharacterized membrane protein